MKAPITFEPPDRIGPFTRPQAGYCGAFNAGVMEWLTSDLKSVGFVPCGVESPRRKPCKYIFYCDGNVLYRSRFKAVFFGIIVGHCLRTPRIYW